MQAVTSRGSDLMMLAKFSNHLDTVAELIEDGRPYHAKELLKETIDGLLVIGDRHGLQLRLSIEGAIE